MEKFLTIKSEPGTYEAIYRLSQQKEFEKIFLNDIIEISLKKTGERLDDEDDPIKNAKLRGARGVLKEIKALFESSYDIAIKMKEPVTKGVY